MIKLCKCKKLSKISINLQKKTINLRNILIILLRCRSRLTHCKEKLVHNNEVFKRIKLGRHKLHVKPSDEGNRIVSTKILQTKIISCFHKNLQHSGSNRMYAAIRQHFCQKGMKDHIHTFVKKGHHCQNFKKIGVKKYGKLPIKDNISPAPFDTVSVNCIGPWNIKVQQEHGSRHLPCSTWVPP